MRSIDKLVALVRERTKNIDYTYSPATGVTTSGISTSLILDFINAGQQHLQAAILAQFPNEFVESVTIPLIGGQEEYSIPDNLFANNKIISVQYSQHGATQDYYDLPQGNIRDRDTRRGTPRFYVRRSGKIFVNPIPQSSVGSIRIEYYRALDTLDIRRGQIQTKTGDLTSITLNSATRGLFPYELMVSEFVSVNRHDGTPTCYAIPITAYDSSTGILTVASGYSIPAGSTIDANSYVTIGKYSTTHSKLAANCERYLITYASKRVLSTDTSESSIEEDAEVRVIETDILQSFAAESRDVTYFPVLDHDILG